MSVTARGLKRWRPHRTQTRLVIGLGRGSTGVVSVSGGTFQTAIGAFPAAGSRVVLVGFDGNGTLNVSGTGAVTANHDLLVAFLPGSVGTVNQSGGTIDAGFLFTNIDGDPVGSTAVINQTGGTINTRIALGARSDRAGTTTMDHSGGTAMRWQAPASSSSAMGQSTLRPTTSAVWPTSMFCGTLSRGATESVTST